MSTTITTNTSVAPANMLTAVNINKPGCPRKCGNLTVPYPFGFGTGTGRSLCSLGFWFDIKCDTSYSPPKAFFMMGSGDTQPEILYISETQMMLRNFQIASRCYDAKGKVISDTPSSYDLIGSPFTFSYTGNKLTVIGCDDYALITYSAGTVSEGYKYDYNVGCLALCSNPNEVIHGSCSGIGCCQTSIPNGLQSFMITLSSLNNHSSSGVSSFQPCGYAFLAGNDSFRFSGAADLSGKVVVNRTTNEVPMVLDWSVGDFNSISGNRASCNEAKKNLTTYACQTNTHCVDFGGGGYHCQCLSGYEGNPYLKPGCTDVDECAQGSSNPCSMVCVNTHGSYKCSCPDGYYGDGLKAGTRCTKMINNSTSSLKKITFGLGVALGSIFLFLVGWWLYSVMKRRNAVKQRAKYFVRNGGLLLQQHVSSDEGVVERIKIFTADELEKATDHFNEDRILGRGGQGIVYKGMLGEGKIVAVKKSKVLDESQLGEFINEVVILSLVNHRNIVKLLGCCLETEVPLLVYEFIPNGSLFHHIHYPNEDFLITWRMRLQIAIDSAGALAYLHSSSSTPIFHRDIKSSNILLDEKYRAKLSDFGTSRSVAIDQTHVTTRVMGTFGYLDPEYFQSSQFTEKSDVYSFGVVLVELLTGQKAIRSTQENKSLTSWFLSHMENSQWLDILDPQVLQEGAKEELLALANLAKQCLDLDGKIRPTMKEALQEIEAARSLHLSRINHQDVLETQPSITTTARRRTCDGSAYSRMSNLENRSLDSAELSLLFNPR
uniref:Uncharacterized protein n=2 Tax=Chenopodium quinoa TaxID=63459 RepID=A0A803KMT2_CHEQI